MKNAFVWMFFVFSVHIVMGCVFDGDGSIYQSYYRRHPTNEDRRNALKDYFPDCWNDWNKLNNLINVAAGPFNITNTVLDTSDAKAYNYQEQGADWPDKFPTCGGQRQTPINIVTTATVQASLPRLVFVDYNRIHPEMDIINNGKTVDILGPWGEDGLDVPTMSGGPLNGTYKLYGVHLHWGNTKFDGAEHLINSKSAALEMHLVHYKASFSSITEAINANLPDSLAVVGFLFNSAFFTSHETSSLFKTLDLAAKGGIVLPAAVPLNLVHRIRSYFTYDGSLTTPTCNEIVRWIVVENPMFRVQQSDLNIFLAKYLVNGSPILGNFRVPQPLNGRIVYSVRT